MDFALVLALWIHTIGLVIVMGYYGILGRILIPSLERTVHGPELAESLAAIERRALPLVLLSVVLFVLTGTYLLVVNPHYGGLGNFFATTWSTLMLVKHALVIAFVALGVAVDWLARDLVYAPDDGALRSTVRRMRLCAEVATGLGALIILLTVAAQQSV
jgi:uncharacterized membrane protein